MPESRAQMTDRLVKEHVVVSPENRLTHLASSWSQMGYTPVEVAEMLTVAHD